MVKSVLGILLLSLALVMPSDAQAVQASLESSDTRDADRRGRPPLNSEIIGGMDWLRGYLETDAPLPDPDAVAEELRNRLRAIEAQTENELREHEGERINVIFDGERLRAVEPGDREYLEALRRGFDGEISEDDGDFTFTPRPGSEFYNWMMDTDTCREFPEFAACEPDARVPLCLREPKFAYCDDNPPDPASTSAPEPSVCDAFIPNSGIQEQREALMAALRQTQEWIQFLRAIE